jgi:flagellar secretion chaperone FliS
MKGLMMKSAQLYAHNQRITAVLSANPAQLVALVFERLLDHLQIAQEKLEVGSEDLESSQNAIDLIESGLRASLNFEQGGEIAQNLNALYTWASEQVLLARIRRDPAVLAQVVAVIEPLAQAWRELADKPASSLLAVPPQPVAA